MWKGWAYVDEGCSADVVGNALECELEGVAEKSIVNQVD